MKRILQIILLCFMVATTALAQNEAKTEIIELNSQSFKQKVWNFEKEKTFNRVGNLPIILDFHATWCGPCKLLSPKLQSIQNKYKGKLIVYKIDVDKSPDLAQRFNVQAMPTMVFIGNKTSFKTELGNQEYDALEKMVNKYLFQK
ncbi:MAG: thioredoxin domain-containing protein [Bacteroidota bacterium]|nr:thioredoxin domain-containing protein [Bacteroidota bacterium]